jgi:hypothetical protein
LLDVCKRRRFGHEPKDGLRQTRGNRATGGDDDRQHSLPVSDPCPRRSDLGYGDHSNRDAVDLVWHDCSIAAFQQQDRLALVAAHPEISDAVAFAGGKPNRALTENFGTGIGLDSHPVLKRSAAEVANRPSQLGAEGLQQPSAPRARQLDRRGESRRKLLHESMHYASASAS